MHGLEQFRRVSWRNPARHGRRRLQRLRLLGLRLRRWHRLGLRPAVLGLLVLLRHLRLLLQWLSLLGPTLLRQRLRARHGHYMTEAMLESQLATLEEPDDALVIDADRAPEVIVAEILRKLKVTKNS